jgi:2-polyprenyl-6-methoxyphenol hydroxylase-like FAD-dependent oxidoreductase
MDEGSDGLAVRVDGPAGAYTIDAEYLVGADGGRGATRKLAGIAFVGMSSNDAVFRIGRGVKPPSEWFEPATGKLCIPDSQTTLDFPFKRSGTGMFLTIASADPSNDLSIVGTLELAPSPDDTYLPGHEHPGFGDPLTLAELQDSIRRVLGVEMPLQPAHTPPDIDLRRYAGINTLIADGYRKGRVLLVGDAAHVQSPIGGPGLNLGLQDAANLGWKLASVLRGTADPALLDTYDTERRIAAESAIMASRAQFALLRPGLEVTALREVFGELATQPLVAERLAELMFISAVHYPAEPTDHPAVGRWVPNIVFTTADGVATRVAQQAHDGRPVLLDFTSNGVIAASMNDVHDTIRLVRGTPREPVDFTGVLVRPDGYVAWASSEPTPDRSGLDRALRRWFGTTTPPHPATAPEFLPSVP